MELTMLKGKIHRAVVKQAELNYVGSITIDPELMDAAGILEYEMVQIVDVENGNRFETYTICGEAGSGMICLNGAAARQVQVGDHVIIMCYASMTRKKPKRIGQRWSLWMKKIRFIKCRVMRSTESLARCSKVE